MKKIDWSQWFLFLIGVVVVEGIAIYLLWNAYPGHEMKVMGWGILILVIGFAGYATYKANEPDNLVRQVGIVGKVVLALLGVASLYGHSAMSRELSTAREAFTEFKQKTDYQQRIKDRDAARDIDVARANSDAMKSQAELERAAALKLRLLDPSQRRIVGGYVRPTPTPKQSPTVEREGGTADAAAGAIATPRTESEVRESWLTWFQVVNFLQILVAVLSALAVSAVRHQYVESNYPDYAAQIQAGGQPVHPGN